MVNVYINNGSFYLVFLVFLLLGLLVDYFFWIFFSEFWIFKKVWEGEEFFKDYIYYEKYLMNY